MLQFIDNFINHTYAEWHTSVTPLQIKTNSDLLQNNNEQKPYIRFAIYGFLLRKYKNSN